MEFKNADRKEASRLTTEKQTDKEWTYFLTFGFKVTYMVMAIRDVW